MWFKKLTGFEETSPQNVRKNLTVDGTQLVSSINGQRFDCGKLEVPTLDELKKKAPNMDQYDNNIQVSEIVANVQELHCNSQNKHAIFQAASQFNLLEMVGPHIIPEKGVDIYERDYTQGPACAIACGAGTIFRNYFAEVNGEIGQTAGNQIDCLDLLGKELNNDELELWEMANGYALVNQNGLLHLNSVLSKTPFEEYEKLKGLLKVGVQWNSEVTLNGSAQTVSQIYCSALPVAYSSIESIYWKRFASLILEATYEATLYASLINFEKTKCNKVFLTLVGGGAFGNDTDWIIDSIKSVLEKFKTCPLNIKIVSYGSSNPLLTKFLEKI